MPNFSDYELELVMEELNDHASTLHALSQRLEATDTDAAHTTQGIAQELWEIRKGLGDGRRPVSDYGQQ